MTMWWVALLLVCAVSRVEPDPCAHKMRCRDCLQTAGCSWCSKPRDKSLEYDTIDRCFEMSRRSSDCEGFVVEPKTGVTEQQTVSGAVVQISPQKASVKLRLDSPVNLSVKYTAVADFPLDVYFLMDLSSTMSDDVENLRQIGKNLTDVLRNITTNFRLGFGSFVDKPVMPFIRPKANEKLKLTHVEGFGYGFKHHLKLTSDTEAFLNVVKAMKTSSSEVLIDGPEGGMDALMQAVVCQKAIGWRDGARKIILYSSDAAFHMAGDGRLANIVVPNDGLCHMDKNNEYYEWAFSTGQDYPSISQINKKVQEHKIHIILAVTDRQLEHHRFVAAAIEGAEVAVLSNDSSNIVVILQEQYRKIERSVQMVSQTVPEVTVKFYSDCLGSGPQLLRSGCEGLLLGSEVEFSVELKLTVCPPEPKDLVVRIHPVGGQTLTVNVTPICSCPCETQVNTTASEYCSGKGILQCGVCECEKDYTGHNCECEGDSTAADPTSSQRKLCQRADDERECSGNGVCHCGLCDCKQGFDGPYCECNRFTCPMVDQRLCGGDAYGECECGSCKCKADWSGSDCQCSTRQDACSPPQKGKLCSGHGKCECNRCVCEKSKDDFVYRGEFCEINPTSPQECAPLRHCVECLTFNSTCKENCSRLHHFIDDEVKAESKSEVMCYSPLDDQKCSFQFTYSYTDGKLVTKAQRNKQCPEPPKILATFLTTTGVILLVGLGTLIAWKVTTIIHDRKEYENFMKQVSSANNFSEANPLYKGVNTTITNPTFSPSERAVTLM